jgi:hypothetical protein
MWAQPPTERQRLPIEAWSALLALLRYVMWLGIAACVGALIVCGAMFAYQRGGGRQMVAEGNLLRICLCAILVGSSALLANAVIV